MLAQRFGGVGLGRGSQSRIAERLGVHRSTICRDMAKLQRWRHGGQEAEQRYLAEKRMQHGPHHAEPQNIQQGMSK